MIPFRDSMFRGVVMSNRYVVIDLETTGNSPKKGDKIIQFAAVVLEEGEIVETYSSLINPKITIPIFIEELTGINDNMVKDAPLFEEIAPKIQQLLEDSFFVAHNVLFDLSFLQEELIMANQEGFLGSVIDTVELARFLYPTLDSYKLNDLANYLGFKHDRPHQADSDAEVTAGILQHLLEKIEDLPFQTCKQLLELSEGLKSDIHLLFEEIVEIRSASLSHLPSHLELVNGLVMKKTCNKTENHPKLNTEGRRLYPMSFKEIEEQLRKVFRPYQNRQGQLNMMDEVYGAFTNHDHLLLEAGTGIGKTMGYLYPAAYFAKETGNKVLISTFTNQLQAQLLNNDIPLLKRLLPFDINISLLKGKSHYLNLSKFEESLHEYEDNYDSCLTKMQILIWLLETETGDVDELNLSSGGQVYWKRIRHNYEKMSDNELWRERDFYTRALRMAEEANMIITNHALLLADLQGNIFPKIDYIILDEAHHFQKVAIKYFGAQLDYFRTRLLLNQFGLLEQKQLLFKLSTYLKNKDISDPIKHLNETISNLFFEMDEFFRTVRIYVKGKIQEEPLFKVSVKVNKKEQAFKNLFHSAERFSLLIKDFVDMIQAQYKLLDLDQTVGSKRLYEEIQQATEELSVVREQIKRFFIRSQEDDIAWIEIDFRSYQNSTTLYLQPLFVATDLQELFFLNKKSVILTSATLSIENDFLYMLNELGLNESTKSLSIPSPFDYRKQVKVLIPEDVPEINSVPIDDYIAAITEQIISIAEVTKGRILVLFTSHEMLRKTHALIKESGLLDEYVLLAQGITGGSQSRLTRNFQKFEKAILFGTNSFWEGIDIPGEDLSCLIMVRLPFTPPDEPFLQAKSEKLKAIGGNPFMQLSLPEAVLKFKQGFGRLIRTSDDKGVLVVLDKRIITTKYGKVFLSSIPDVSIEKGNIEKILYTIEDWLN
jgi:ATP-dependent DNA helicase DinG